MIVLRRLMVHTEGRQLVEAGGADQVGRRSGMRNWFRAGKRRTAAAIALGAISLLVLGAVAAQQNHAREALRYVVHNMCVTGQLKSGDPSPCSKVDVSGGVDKGYAI